MGWYGYHVIDGDGHVAEPESMWARFLEPAYRDAAPRIVTDNRDVKRVLISASSNRGSAGCRTGSSGWTSTTPS